MVKDHYKYKETSKPKRPYPPRPKRKLELLAPAPAPMGAWGKLLRLALSLLAFYIAWRIIR